MTSLHPSATAIDHVALIVVDVDSAISTFTRELGMSVIADEVLENPHVRLTYLAAGSDVLQLVQPLGPGPIADYLADYGEGLHHVCFDVPAIHDAAKALSQGDAVAPVVFTGGRGRRTCFLGRRRHGLLVELAELPS